MAQIPEDMVFRDVSDHRIKQRGPHCGHANPAALVALEKSVLDQAPYPLRIDEAAADLLKRPWVDAFA